MDRWTAGRLDGNISPSPIFAELSNGVICFLIYTVIYWFIGCSTLSGSKFWAKIRIFIPSKNLDLSDPKFDPNHVQHPEKTWYHLWIKKQITPLESPPKIGLGGFITVQSSSSPSVQIIALKKVTVGWIKNVSVPIIQDLYLSCFFGSLCHRGLVRCRGLGGWVLLVRILHRKFCWVGFGKMLHVELYNL